MYTNISSTPPQSKLKVNPTNLKFTAFFNFNLMF